ALAGSGLLLPHRALRSRDPPAPSRQLAGALPLDRAGGLPLFPQAPVRSAPRRAARPGDHAVALRYPRRAGTRARYPAVQARRTVDHARCHAAGLRAPAAALSRLPGGLTPAPRPMIQRFLNDDMTILVLQVLVLLVSLL